LLTTVATVAIFYSTYAHHWSKMLLLYLAITCVYQLDVCYNLTCIDEF